MKLHYTPPGYSTRHPPRVRYRSYIDRGPYPLSRIGLRTMRGWGWVRGPTIMQAGATRELSPVAASRCIKQWHIRSLRRRVPPLDPSKRDLLSDPFERTTRGCLAASKSQRFNTIFVIPLSTSHLRTLGKLKKNLSQSHKYSNSVPKFHLFNNIYSEKTL